MASRYVIIIQNGPHTQRIINMDLINSHYFSLMGEFSPSKSPSIFISDCRPKSAQKLHTVETPKERNHHTTLIMSIRAEVMNDYSSFVYR